MGSRLPVLALLLAVLLSGARGDRCGLLEPLPTTFDTISYLGFDGELHLQGEYLVDFQTFMHDITFEIKQESVVRFYTAKHEVDIDLWLYEVNNPVFLSVRTRFSISCSYFAADSVHGWWLVVQTYLPCST